MFLNAGNTSRVRSLIGDGINMSLRLNLRYEDKRTPLHLAAEFGKKLMFECYFKKSFWFTNFLSTYELH